MCYDWTIWLLADIVGLDSKTTWVSGALIFILDIETLGSNVEEWIMVGCEEWIKVGCSNPVEPIIWVVGVSNNELDETI